MEAADFDSIIPDAIAPAGGKPSVTMWRRGIFAVPGLDPLNKCGPDGNLAFAFDVWITCERLDGQGFVADNFAVMKTFNEKYATGRWQASCEQLAGGAIYMMRKLCPRATAIKATIHPISDASLTVEWRAGQDMPDFFPKRLDTPARARVRAAAGKEA
jgi:hypothetical protein